MRTRATLSVPAVAAVAAAVAMAAGEPAKPDAKASNGLRVTRTANTQVDHQSVVVRGKYGMAMNGMAFQQDALVTEAGYQYIAYYDAAFHVCVGRRKLPDGAWEVLRLTDYKLSTDDAHNVVCMGICPKDGTIHLAFDHHDSTLHYRVSEKRVASAPERAAWKPERFGPVVSELEKGKRIDGLTYPRFWQTPAGGLQMSYRLGRSGRGDVHLADYDPGTGTWRNSRLFVSGGGAYKMGQKDSPSRSPYFNRLEYGPGGKLHATWVWRENFSFNHDLMYACSEDIGMSWRDTRGKSLPRPITVNTPGIVVREIGLGYGLMNQQGQTVDSRGRVHVVVWHCTDESLKAAGSKPGASFFGPLAARRYLHYWRDETGVWHTVDGIEPPPITLTKDWRMKQAPTYTGVATGRPKVFADKADNVFIVFADNWRNGINGGWGAINGKLIIMGATSASKWADWKTLHIENGPFMNEPVIDPYRWKQDGVLSVLAQISCPRWPPAPTPLRVLDFKIEGAPQAKE